MSDPVEKNLDTCGCCDPQLPGSQHPNPPGQPELQYRVGTHGAFLRRMIARLPRWRTPDGEQVGQRPLSALTTRDADDPAIALLDGWAIVAHVLSFYQERIANEGFLHTATERRSVLELARAIGYELSPGVAASTFLAFTVDDAPGAPGTAVIAARTQVQSVPAGQGELPQTFETESEFVAYAAWNAIRPQLTRPQEIADPALAGEIYLAGTGLQLKPGDLLLLVRDAGTSGAQTAIKQVRAVAEDAPNNRTYVQFVGAAQPAAGAGSVEAAPTTQSAATATPAPTAQQLPFSAANIQALILSQELTESELQAVLTLHGWDGDGLLTYVNETGQASGDGVAIYAFRQRAGFFGHNAPRWETLPTPAETRGSSSDPYGSSWDGTSARSIWEDSQGVDYTQADAYLERSLSRVVPDSWLLMEAPDGSSRLRRAYQVAEAFETSLVDYALSGKATAVVLREPTGADVSDKPATFKVRTTTAHLESEQLQMSLLPVSDDIPAGSKELVLEQMLIDLQKGQPLVLSGEQADASGVLRAEVLTLKEIMHSGGRTTLHFEEALAYSYLRSSVVINANVVPASHGETVTREVLGSGSGATTNQRFTLSKAPLTYVSAANTAGAESTLTVRVNGLAWAQVASLHPLGPRDKSYIVRIDDDAKATVIFGDGTHGARLPTGEENVVAEYRSGIGSAGAVDAGALTLLKTRPFGVRSVTNLTPASGGVDPESLDDARENAPLTVTTMERIVSLRDYENFARAFAGIGKAAATSLWSGEAQVVHLTIADTNSKQVAESSTLYTNLVAAINSARDPLRQVRVESFLPRSFNLAAKILYDSAYVWSDVQAAIMEALLASFAFAERSFGQPATSAEVMRVIHTVDGVVAVDLDKLHLVDESGAQQGPDLRAILPAAPAHWDAAAQKILPAELLLINPAGISLSIMGAA